MTGQNCHGCMWLDRYKEDGRGYCCMVEESEQGRALRAYLEAHREEYILGRKEEPSVKVRTPDMERCELYEAGDFATRYSQKRAQKSAPPDGNLTGR